MTNAAFHPWHAHGAMVDRPYMRATLAARSTVRLE